MLGGSSSTTGGKVSKLAALAAARRKKEADKASERQSTQQSSSVALLDQLNVSRTGEATNATASTAASNFMSEDSKVNDENDMPGQTRRYPLRRKRTPSPPSEIPPEALKKGEPGAQQVLDTIILQASPSMFAKTVLGDHATEPPLRMLHNDFKLPYITDPNYTKSIAFTGPSPDDIVSNAQAKGAAYAGKAAVKS